MTFETFLERRESFASRSAKVTSRSHELACLILSRNYSIIPYHNFIAIFWISSYLGSQWCNRLIPQLRVSTDLMGRTGESVQILGTPE